MMSAGSIERARKRLGWVCNAMHRNPSEGVQSVSFKSRNQSPRHGVLALVLLSVSPCFPPRQAGATAVVADRFRFAEDSIERAVYLGRFGVSVCYAHDTYWFRYGCKQALRFHPNRLLRRESLSLSAKQEVRSVTRPAW